MRKFLVGLLVVLGLMGATMALDVDKVSVGGSYTVNYSDALGGYQSVPNCWGAELGYDLKPGTVLIGEVGVGYNKGVALTAMGGVRYFLPFELPPDWLYFYVQALGGVAHKTGYDHGTGLAVGVGGGFLIRLDKERHWSFKPVQVDYIHTFGDVSANTVRISVGFGYHF